MKEWNFLFKSITLISLLFLTSCAGLYENRTFFDEMDRESEGFFSPGDSFEVTAGDVGNPYRTRDEINKRTPYSYDEKRKENSGRSLNRELASIKSSMSPSERGDYNSKEKYLPSVSERIYFLGLSKSEREVYLSQRVPSGVSVSEGRNSLLSYGDSRLASRNNLEVGMGKNAVQGSWGRPSKVSIAGDPRNENERWAYYQSGEQRYVFFEDGKVQGWEIR